MGSLNSGTTASGYRYVEKVYNQNFRFVPINGSLIKESANHEICAVDEDTDNPTNYKGWDSTRWDRIGNPNMWFGSGTGVVTSGNTISLSAESNASGQWLIVNGAVTTKDVLPPLLATYPDAPEPHHDPDYSGNNGTRNTVYYSRVLIRQLTTEWVDKDGKELKTPVTDTDIKPADTISHYVFDHDDTDSVGSVRQDALSNNPKLKYIEFGKSLFVLCEDSMLSLPSLEKVVLPESLEKIDAWVFSGENLKDIYLPSNVTKLSNLFCLSKSCSPDLKIHVKTGSVTAENIKNSDLVAENKVVFE